MRLFPEPLGDGEGDDPHVVPPGAFIAVAVQLAVMISAERHGELIADLDTECFRLGEANVMGLSQDAVADDAWL